MKHIIFSALLLAPLAALHAADTTINPCDFGAKPDGQTLCTEAIQKAIDQCAGSGGGTVRLEAGTYLSGTVRLKDKVTLFIAADATLLGSTNILDYPAIQPALRSYTDRYVNRSLIYAERASNIAVAGPGTINGRGEHFPKMPRKDRDAFYALKNRPYLMRLVECREVSLRGVTARNSAMWCLDFLACEGLTIDGIRLKSRVTVNNDGIDLEDCRKVLVANCDIDSGDDAICLKSTTRGFCENILVTNCVLRSGQTAIKTGTESIGGFRDIVVRDCRIERSGRGIALDIYDGGFLERVSVSNVTMRDVDIGISSLLSNRGRRVDPSDPAPALGAIKDITIENVQMSGVRSAVCMFRGQPGKPVRNVTLRGVRLSGESRAERKHPWSGAVSKGIFDFAQVEGLRLQQVEADFSAGTASEHGLYCAESSDVALSRVLIKRAETALPLLVFDNVSGALVDGCEVPEKTKTFLSVSGEKAQNIRIKDNRLNGAKAFDLATGVPAHAVTEQ
jgi:polygalacturonase